MTQRKPQKSVIKTLKTLHDYLKAQKNISTRAELFILLFLHGKICKKRVEFLNQNSNAIEVRRRFHIFFLLRLFRF